MSNIPPDLIAFDSWVVFEITDDGKKIPYTPGTKSLASSTNKSTWRSFEEAQADGRHLGYAFSSADPFFFLDLDEDHPELFEAINTYAQRSISGAGIHLIGRGSFEGEGKHPAAPAVGLFQSARFALMTGQVVDGRTTIKDVDSDTLQSIHTWLSRDNNTATVNLVEQQETTEDAEVIAKATARFDTFTALYEGNPGDDHSESDHALISMLADCSTSNEQVRRLFRASALCRPHRANDKYINRSLRKVRGKQEHVAGFFENEVEDVEAEQLPAHRSDRSMIDSLPEGLIKRIADWHWKQSLYPLQECSVAVAISTISTVAGRNYQLTTKSGLNLWLILVAETSWGKDEYQNGISKIFNIVTKANAYGVGNFSKLLAGSMASGEGLEDLLCRQQRVNSYFSEFDITFKNLCSAQPMPHHNSLKQQMLMLYSRSGQGSTLQRRTKAKGKEEEDYAPVESPCLVVSGETIPSKLYSSMTLTEIESGFLQRFCILNANPISVTLKANPDVGFEMPQDLIDELLDLFVRCDVLAATDEYVKVEMNKDAKILLTEYLDRKRVESLTSESEATKQVMNRAGLKALRLASLFAVSANYLDPRITLEQAEWAIMFMESIDAELIEKFNSGEMNTGQSKQETDIKTLIQKVRTASCKKRIEMGINVVVSRHKDIIPYSWLKKNAVSLPSFASDKSGAVNAFERCLNHLVIEGFLNRIPNDTAIAQYGKDTGMVLGVSDQI